MQHDPDSDLRRDADDAAGAQDGGELSPDAPLSDHEEATEDEFAAHEAAIAAAAADAADADASAAAASVVSAFDPDSIDPDLALAEEEAPPPLPADTSSRPASRPDSGRSNASASSRRSVKRVGSNASSSAQRTALALQLQSSAPVPAFSPTASAQVNNSVGAITYNNTTNIHVAAAPAVSAAATAAASAPGTSLAQYSASAGLPASLASFQSHALSSVQGLAASFGTIATVLAKDQNASARESESTRRKMAHLQSSVDKLARENRELSDSLARIAERAQAQVSQLHDRLTNVNKAIESGGGKAAETIRNSNMLSYVGSLSAHQTPAAVTGALDPSTRVLLDRLARAESELAAQKSRADRERSNLRLYFTNLQAQIKSQNQTCFEMIRHNAATATPAPSSAAAGAGEKKKKTKEPAAPVFKELALPSFMQEDDAAESAAGAVAISKDAAAAAPSSALARSNSGSSPSASDSSLLSASATVAGGLAMSPELAVVFAQLLAEAAENRATNQALTALVVSAGGATSRSNFESVLRAAQAQQSGAKDVARENLERAVTAAAAAALAARPVDAAQLAFQQSQEAKTREAIRAVLASSTPPSDDPMLARSASGKQQQTQTSSATAGASLPPQHALRQTSTALLSPTSSGMPSSLPGALTPSAAAAAAVSAQYSTWFPSFSPRTALNAEMEAAATRAVADAFAAHAASQASAASAAGTGPGGKGAANPLAAGTIAASMAAQAAQLAAKQAQEALNSITFMRENGAFSSSSASASAPALELEDPAAASGSSLGSAIQSKKVAEKLRAQDQVLARLDSTVSSMGNQLSDLARSSGASKESSASSLQQLAAEVASMNEQFSALSRQFQAQHRVLDSRLTAQRTELDSSITQLIDELSGLDRRVESKADLKLILDKVSRAEYSQALKKLKSSWDDLSNRSVNREEYRLQLMEIREVMNEDQRERVAQLARIANELSKLVNDMASKASKADVLDLAQVVAAQPKVGEAVENLKGFVSASLDSRTSEIMEVAVDRKQLKRSMQRLLRSLQEEVSSATMPVNCDACALRTGVHSGTNCLSCAQQMKLGARVAQWSGGGSSDAASPEPPAHEILASRGGGFMVTASQSAAAAAAASAAASYSHSPSPSARPRVVVSSGYGSRPGTSGGVGTAGGPMSPSERAALARSRPATTGRSFSRTAVMAATPSFDATAGNDPFPPAPGSVSPTPGPVPFASSEAAATPQRAQLTTAGEVVGSDGRVYHGRGARTHRLVSTARKSAARTEEETDEVGAEAQWEEKKESGATAATGSQSARVASRRG